MADKPPHERPELYTLRPLPETRPYASPAPDRVLVNRAIADLDDLVATCRPAKLALGVTKDHPAGQVAWSWRAAHGFGQRTADGKITESVRVRFDDRTPSAPSTRGAVLLWTRPVPDRANPDWALALLLATLVPPSALGRHQDSRWFDYMAPLDWLMIAAVLRPEPTPKWTLAYSSLFDLGEDGRITDIPRRIASTALRTEVTR